MRGLTSKHAIGGVVAVAVLAIALGDGGFHPKGLAMITAVGWVFLLAGVLTGAFAVKRVPADAAVAAAAVVLLALLAGASMAWSPDAGQAFEEAVRWAGYAAVFVLSLLVARRGSGARGLLAGITVGLTGIGAVALSGRLLVRLPDDEGLAQALPSAEGLLSYPIGYWNGLAACMALALVGLAWFAAHGGSEKVRRLAVAAMPLAALAIFLAESRGGAVAVAVGLAALLASSPRRRRRVLGSVAVGLLGGLVLIAVAAGFDALRAGGEDPEAQRQGVTMLGLLLVISVIAAGAAPSAARIGARIRIGRRVWIGAAVAALVAVAVIGPGKIAGSFQDPLVSAEQGAGAQLASGTGRYQYWEAAIEAFAEEPLVGIGAGGYESYWDQHGELARSVRFAHSLPLGTAAELGVLGLAALTAFFAIAIGVGVSRAREGSAEAAAGVGLIGAGLAASLLEWTWQIPAVAIPVLLGAAVACGPATARRPEPARFAAGLRRVAAFLGLGGRSWQWRPRVAVAPLTPLLVAAGAAAVYAAAILWSSDVRLSASDSALADGRLDAAGREARAAARLAPWDAAPRRRLAVIERTAGHLEAATRELDLAIELAPADWELWFFASRLDAEQGADEASEVALAWARELNPNHPLFRVVRR